MGQVKISSINFELGRYSFSMKELVDEFFKKKLSKDVRDFCKEKLGIDKVYKAYDLSKFDLDDPRYKTPDQDVTDIQIESARKTLGIHGKKSDVSLLMTVGDNPKDITPAPGVALFRELHISENVSYVPLQGTACSALCESIKVAADHIGSGGKDVLLSITNNYTPPFLHKLKEIKTPISMETKESLYYLIYGTIFSEGSGSAIVSSGESRTPHVEMDTDMISARRDVYGRGEYWLRYEPSPDGLTFGMYLDIDILKKMLNDLPHRNIFDLRSMFPEEAKSVNCYNLHTAGKPLVDLVVKSSDIPKEKTGLTYDIMRETGNTGAFSTLQGLQETIDRKVLDNGEYGMIHDFGWGGASSGIYKLCR